MQMPRYYDDTWMTVLVALAKHNVNIAGPRQRKVCGRLLLQILWKDSWARVCDLMKLSPFGLL